MNELHVSPGGDDAAPGTTELPLATVHRAQRLARAMDGKVTVRLSAGRHRLDRTLELTEADSGITFQGAADGRTVLSGGTRITGWRTADGVWEADLDRPAVRQLYVEDRRAARSGITGLPGSVSRTPTGYVTDSLGPLDWANPGDVEFVYSGLYPWTEARIAVAEVSRQDDATVITMAQPAFGRANALYNSAWDGQTSAGPGLPSRVENVFGSRPGPGEFAVDGVNRRLRYRSGPGEDPESTMVVAPVLETLVRVTGARDLGFRQVVFAEATWLRPGGAEGFLHYHGNGHYDGGPVDTVTIVEDEAWVMVPRDAVPTPACVVFDECTDVLIEDCRFTRLGATGLGISGGSGVKVLGCDFDTLSASAVAVSGTAGAVLENNWIHHIGLEFSGAPGIEIAGTTGCRIVHNHIAEVPHCGVVAGPAEGTRILNNLTSGTMTTLADGGGVYLSGAQGSSATTGAVVSGNVIRDTRTPYNFGLYTDYGASWVTVERNVVVRADNTAVLTVSPPLENVTYRDNYWDAEPLGADEVPSGVVYQGNTTVADPSELEEVTAGIRAGAGLTRDR